VELRLIPRAGVVPGRGQAEHVLHRNRRLREAVVLEDRNRNEERLQGDFGQVEPLPLQGVRILKLHGLGLVEVNEPEALTLGEIGIAEGTVHIARAPAAGAFADDNLGTRVGATVSVHSLDSLHARRHRGRRGVRQVGFEDYQTLLGEPRAGSDQSERLRDTLLVTGERHLGDLTHLFLWG
jgi:hypothetical protein